MIRIEKIDQEQREIKNVLDIVLNKDYPHKDKYLEKFLMDKLDPKNKFVIRFIRENDDNVRTFESNSINSDLTSHELLKGIKYKKVKLQCRFETSNDIDELLKFLTLLKYQLEKLDEEEIINNKRKETLDDILNPKEPNFPKLIF